MRPIYLLAFFTGFLSLSQEILWVRLFSFANHSLPQAFAFVLIVYLFGIAIGAEIGKKFCQRDHALWLICGMVLLVSGYFDLISPWVYTTFTNTGLQLWCGGLLILLTALFKAIIFPIVHHLGVEKGQAEIGQHVSRVYVANIIGATLGPIITGIFLLDYFSTQHAYVLCALLGIAGGLFCLKNTIDKKSLLISSALTSLFAIFLFAIPTHRLIALSADNFGAPLKTVIENSHGIVTIYQGGDRGDIVFGGNVYDGKTNLDLNVNSNHLNRLVILASLFKTPPTRVLMIGLSIGSWLKIITSFPDIKSIDVVEINPGYLDAIKKYPAQFSALKDPRVHVYIDDGRRWLKAHPEQYYNLIVMNTTYYWRAYSSTLLSSDFLKLIKQHMMPAAILTYNTTSSPDALLTAATVFPHTYLYENFAIAADFDWRVNLHAASAINKLTALRLDGQPLLQNDAALAKQFLNEPLSSVEDLQARVQLQRRHVLEVITDKNLITEYKYGRRLTS